MTKAAELETKYVNFQNCLEGVSEENIRTLAFMLDAYPFHGDTSRDGMLNNIWAKICELKRHSERLRGVQEALRYIREQHE